MSVTEPEEGVSWRRLSARMLLIHPVRELGHAIPALIGLVFAGRAVGDGQFWWLAPLGVVWVIVLSVLRWTSTRYRVTPERVQLRTGLLQRSTTTTPVDRVRTVDVTASVLHRLLGLVKVDIGTGSNAVWGGLSLDSLPAAEAAALRAELLHRSAVVSLDPSVSLDASDTEPPIDAPVGDALVAGDHDTELARLDPRWVRLAPFTLSGVLGAGAIVGVAWNAVDRIGIEIGNVGPFSAAFSQVQRIPVWLDLVGGMVAVLGFVTAISISGYVLSYWGFRLSRHTQGTLHITRGLLTTRATSIEERRLRGVELSEPLLLRAVHGARLGAITTGLKFDAGAQDGGLLLLPPAPSTVVLDVATQILGDPAPMTVSLIAHGPAARRRRFLRALMWSFVLVAAAGVAIWKGAPQWLALPALLTVPVAALLAADRYRSLGHAFAAGWLVTRAGSLNRRRDVLESDGIIGWTLSETFFQRRAGLATLAATTAAGSQLYEVTDVPLAVALSLGDRVLPGLLGEFLDPNPQT